MTLLHVAGTGLRGSGYPNATQTLRLLRERTGWDIRDRSRWMPEGATLWQLLGGGRLRSLLQVARLLALNAIEAVRILGDAEARRAWVYVPYPCVFLLWWMSWVPRRVRPRLVADAYISLWDAAFRDRGAGAVGGVASRMLRAFESRALRTADRVLVDTVANRDWFIAEFRIAPSRIRSVPLATDPGSFPDVPAAAPAAPAGPARVLFVGTLVPLHGIEVVSRAARLLHGRGAPLGFVFVGDGQDRAALVRLVADLPAHRVHWEREWQSPDAIARRMREADICLGVFGGDGKAARVLPYKIYLALAAGRPVVTQRDHSLPQGLPPIPAVLVAPTADGLADALQALAADPERRAALAAAARAYFDTYLGPDALAAIWRELIEDGPEPGTPRP